MQPDVIGSRYHVVEAIGQGGMGTVWLARDEKLARDVAIKQVGLLPGESVTDSARALREARTSASLSHRNLVTVFDVVDEDGVIWMVMEHVPSRSLSDLIAAEGRLDPERTAAIGAQVADALAATHAAGTIHRDVKPGNVLVTGDGTAKLGDFGIAHTRGDPALTQSGFVTGTPGYFSPELAGGADPGPAADVWALGATLYAAVEGRPPYPSQTNPVAVLHDIATRQPPRPLHAGPLEQPLLRMMDRDPGSRWSMADAASVLRRLARTGSPEAAGPAPSPTARVEAPRAARPAPEPGRTGQNGDGPERDGRRRGAVLALVAATALLVVLGGIALLASQREDPQDSAVAGGATDEATPTGSPTPSRTPSASMSPDAGSGGGVSAQTAFLEHYFDLAPGGTDEAWAMLGPHERAKAGGRDSFNGFWRTIDSVDVSDVRSTGDGSVEATLTYHKADGGVSRERHALDLIRSDSGGYLIDHDTMV